MKASGASFVDVVMVNSFHIWSGPNFAGSKAEQLKVSQKIADVYLTPPYAAWTAVGTPELIADNAVVEVQLIAYSPQAAKRRR